MDLDEILLRKRSNPNELFDVDIFQTMGNCPCNGWIKANVDSKSWLVSFTKILEIQEAVQKGQQIQSSASFF